MKKILMAALPVAAIAFMAFKSISDPLTIGSTLPSAETKMKDITGKEVSFKDAMKKNGLLVMFSCNTCPVVKKYQSRTLDAAKLAAGKNIGVILLNPNEATRTAGDSYEDMQSYAKEQGYDFNYVVDNNSAMADAFGATRTPEVFLFDKNNKLVYHGAIDDNPNAADQVGRKHLDIAINELVTGKSIETPTTKSVGCTIKRTK
ncbi:thioredoxin family protein [Terrimonas sp. NA20]|uniref:Thioredoxin family protein n=1 Tax=Terrimonas ginsenosidimutans TaxID=2908004 RepID=A0ABS9KYX8_9BACT|nr:thioredoxin family protein [Terrimonas ginsenosidimutans]MCG2617525.1 thioredoxin family protein [Terrimonas ginsenosidimutans]